jgi:hypothetical protein
MDFNKKFMAIGLIIGAYSFIAYGDLIVTDQEFIPDITMGCYINEGCKYIGQSFTAGKSGKLFDVSIDVYPISNDYNLKVMLFDAENGKPTSNLLASKLLDQSYASLSYSIIFDNDVEIIAGQQYAIVVNYPDAPEPLSGMRQGIWMGASGYDGGNLIYGNNLVTWGKSKKYDLRFDTRLSVSEAVPEPSTLPLLFSSILFFIGIRSIFYRKQK